MRYGIVVFVSLFLTAARAEDAHIPTSATRALLTVLRRGDFRRFLYASGVHRRLFSLEERPQDIERVPQGQEERPHPPAAGRVAHLSLAEYQVRVPQSARKWCSCKRANYQ